MNIQSEWDPVLTEALKPYAWVRVSGGLLQLKLSNDYIVYLDAKCIPQLRKILARLDNKLEILA